MKRSNGNCFHYFLFNFLLANLLVTAAIRSHAQTVGEPVVVGKKFEIHSKVLNETRSLLIATPEGYDQATERYPVLYVLDGDENFVQTVVVAALMARDRLEEAATVLQHDPKNYPAPWNQLDALARAYAQRGDSKQAIRFYKLSLEENPKNDWARKKLGELGVDVQEKKPQQH
jgi:predicted Zn-dependent protease